MAPSKSDELPRRAGLCKGAGGSGRTTSAGGAGDAARAEPWSEGEGPGRAKSVVGTAGPKGTRPQAEGGELGRAARRRGAELPTQPRSGDGSESPRRGLQTGDKLGPGQERHRKDTPEPTSIVSKGGAGKPVRLAPTEEVDNSGRARLRSSGMESEWARSVVGRELSKRVEHKANNMLPRWVTPRTAKVSPMFHTPSFWTNFPASDGTEPAQHMPCGGGVEPRLEKSRAKRYTPIWAKL